MAAAIVLTVSRERVTWRYLVIAGLKDQARDSNSTFLDSHRSLDTSGIYLLNGEITRRLYSGHLMAFDEYLRGAPVPGQWFRFERRSFRRGTFRISHEREKRERITYSGAKYEEPVQFSTSSSGRLMIPRLFSSRRRLFSRLQHLASAGIFRIYRPDENRASFSLSAAENYCCPGTASKIKRFSECAFISCFLIFFR